jgi:hypothetical protein
LIGLGKYRYHEEFPVQNLIIRVRILQYAALPISGGLSWDKEHIWSCRWSKKILIWLPTLANGMQLKHVCRLSADCMQLEAREEEIVLVKSISSGG